MACENIYDSEMFQKLAGGTLRPGGMATTEEALGQADIPKGALVLDAGCGMGETVAFLKENGYAASGIDISPKLIRIARDKYACTDVRRGDIYRLPWPDGYFHGVFCECTLSLLRQPHDGLKEFFRVLQPEGKLIISDLYLQDSEESKETQNGAEGGTINDAKTGQKLIAQAGFQLVAWQDTTPYLKQFIAGLAWEHGSLEQFRYKILPGGAPRGKLGYYWSVWEK